MDTRDAGRLGGLKGGKATGAAKRRGDSAYYRELRAKRRAAKPQAEPAELVGFIVNRKS